MKKLFGSKGKHAKSTNKIMSRSIALLLAFIMLFGVVFTALSNEITALADGIVLVALSDDVMILTDDRGEYDYTDTDSDVIDSDYDVATDDVATDDDGYLSETDDDYLSIYMDEEAIADVVAYDGYIGIMPLNVNLWYINTDVPRLPASPGGLNIYRITNLTELSFRHRTRFDGYDNHRMMFYYGIGPAGTPFHENAFIVGITEGVNINTGFSYGTLSEGIYFADISERTAWNEGTVLPPLPGHWGQSMLNVWALPQSAFIEINVQRTSSFVDIRGVDATGERYQINNHDNSTAPGQGQAGFPLGTFPLGTEEPLFNNNRLTYLDQPPVINPRSITVGRPVQDRHGEISEDEDETWWEIRLADGTVAASGTMADLGPHGQIPDSAIATLDTNVVYTVVMRVQESVPAGFPDPENIWSESRGRFMFTPLLDIEKKVRCITDGTGHLDGHDYIESRVGDHIVYTIRVTNRSPLGVNDLLMIDDLAGLVGNYITGIRDITLNGVPVSPQSSALVGTELRVGIPHLAGGAYADISFTATVLPGAAGESWVNEARLRDANNDQLWFYSVEREPVYDQHPAGLNPDGTVRYETVRRYQYTENRDRPLICEAEVEAPPAPNLEILKLVNGYPSIVSDVNETLTYTIRVRNTGYAAKTNFYMVDDLNHLLNPPTPLADARITDIRNIRVDDVAAPGTFAGGVLTVHIESLAPGDYVLISFQATVLPEASGHSFRNTARLVDENGEQMYEYEWSYEYLQEWCDTEDDYVYVEDANGNRIPVYSHGPSDRPLKSPAKVVVPPPGLRIEKKVSNYGDSELHDNITADVGELITYTITVSNRGEGTKLNFQMVDDLGNTTPNGRNLIDVYIENVHNIRVNGAALAAPSTFVNGVLTVVIPSLAPDAQVVIEFDAYVLPAAAGQTWTNLSVLQDRHGNQLYYEYEYEYWCEEEEEYVTVTQERPHQDESTVVVPKPLVRINKSVDRPYPQFVDVGEYLTYTIEVRNLPRDNEPTATALDFWMIDDLAHLVDTYIDNVRNVTATVQGGLGEVGTVEIVGGNLVRVHIIELPVNGLVTITFQATVQPGASGRPPWTNVARLYEDGDRDNKLINYVRDEEGEWILEPCEYDVYYINEDYATKIVPAPGLQIEKKVSNYGDSELHDNITSYVDEVITYTITVSNTGEGTKVNFQMVDDLGNTTPNGRNLIDVYIENVHNIRVNGAALAAPSTFVNGVLTVVIPSLAPNAQVVITFDAYVLPAAAGQTWTNLAVLQDRDGNQLYYEYEYEYWCEEEEEYVTVTQERPHQDESTVVVPKPLVRINKSVDRPYPQFVDVGEYLTYTIEVRNLPRDNEPTATAFDFWMIDDLAHLVDTYIDNVRNVTATVQGGLGEVGTVEIVGGNLVRVHIIELPVNGLVTITFQATVQPGAAGLPPWTNVARLYEDGDRDNKLINYVRDEDGEWILEPCEYDVYYINEDCATKIVPAPGLRIEKKVSNYGDSELHDNITSYIGELITYTITVSNTGYSTKVNFQMVDDLGNTTPNGRNLIDVYIEDVHNIRVNGVALAAPSTFVNGVLTVVIPSLAPNAQVVITFDAYVLPAAAGQTWTNLAVLQDQDGNQLYYEYEYEYWCYDEEEYVTVTKEKPHQDESTVVVPKPFVRINKSVDRPYPQFVDVGEYLTYTIEVRNLPRDNEPTATALDFWMIDDLAHLVDTYIDDVRNVIATVEGGLGEVGTVEIVGGNLVRVHIIELPVNGLVTITFQATVQPGAAGLPPWTNIARLYEDGDRDNKLINYVRDDEGEWMREPCEDGGYYINEDCATKIVPAPGLRIEKKVSNYGDSELHDNITGYIDEVITYTITVSNTGDGAMDNFQVVDDLGNTTPNGRNLIGVYIDNVHNIRVNGAALVAPSTFVNDVLTVVIPSLAPNAQVVITFDAYVLPAARGQTWTNLAVLQDQDGNQLYYEYEYEYWCEEEEEYVTRTRRRPHRDESTVEVPKPFLRIIKSVNRPYPQFVNVGEHLTYTIEVRNLPRDNEPTATAFDFWMIDDLAHLVDTYIDNVRNVTATVQGGFGEVGTVEIVGGNLVRVHIIELPVNGIVTITFEATVQPGAAGRPPWTNIARLYEDGDGNSELINYVRGDEDNWMREPGEDDGYYINEDDATKIVPDEHVPSPAMSIEKRVNGVDVYTVPQGGSPLRYTIVARNTSDYDATGFRVVDDLSRLINTYLAEFTLANVTITPAAATTAVTLNGGVLTVVLGTVAPGDYVTIEISAQLRAGLVMNSQRFNNTAILQTPEETEAGRSTATVILPPPPPPTPPGSMPQTGIEANAELWLTLLGIAVMVAIGAAIVIKRKDKERSKNT